MVREDPYNADLLFVGTDVGAYMSLDRGASWHRFMTGLPTVPVHDLKIHPRDRELIAATHGRSIWIVDISPLEQLTDAVLTADAYLFEPKTAYQFGGQFVGGGSTGHQWFESASPQYGAEIVYRLTSGGPRDTVSIVITDVKGDTVQTLRGTGGPGLHRVTWNFRGEAPPREPLGPAAKRDSILQARRVEQVFDSLKTEGTLPPMMLDRMKERILSGNTQEIFRAVGGFGGGGPQAQRGWVERPGESQPRGAARRAAAAQQRQPGEQPAAGERRPGRPGEPGAGGFAALANMDRSQLFDIFRALRRPGQRGFGGFGRGGQRGPIVETGDYLVSITVNGETMSRVLRVEEAGRAAGRSVAGGRIS